MSVDAFLGKTYDRQNYNCAHFIAEVWASLFKFDIKDNLEGFLLPPKDRFVKAEIRTKFKKILKPESPCIVLMQRPKSVPHVGLFYKNKVLQLHENGVEYMPLEIATRGFNKIGFYLCLKN